MIRNCSDHGRIVACKDTIECIGHLRRHVVIQSLAKKKKKKMSDIKIYNDNNVHSTN